MSTEQADPTAFVDPVPMEGDPDSLYPGDHGVLDLDERRVLVRLLQRRFLLAERNPDDWKVLVASQLRIESHLNDLFVRLIVDHSRGVAYKEQVRSDDFDVPILLRDDAYTRAETLVLVYLRTIYQRESTSGEQAVRVDVEEVEQTVLSYFSDADGNTARRQKAIRSAISRLERDGLLDEESEGRYRISPIVEIVLSAERLRELSEWLRDRTARRATDNGPVPPDSAAGGHDASTADTSKDASEDDEL
ncbi:DUF4194 domain-containing protein [Propionimicrobium sp. PCR01-08-3]|uniref:DUF4194 domain-containing protein n=1 Tax=Propionimicrobium sp. PCR01-08-3 TaxID=3052086 RepID=UPI00255CAF5D|nr:DUF4194 domain-containing protein [Propionimicrobium sp. PCR01-08-3]WIY84010.1 DUF4194 domain-containing protein [Propionimicrobium sp. PCR01-08-3]